MHTRAFLLIATLALSACSSAGSVACTTSRDCMSGLVCVDNACRAAAGNDAAAVDAAVDAGVDAAVDAGVDAALDAAFDAGPPPPTTNQLDLLFVVDNSNSMTEEQTSLSAEMPALLAGLTSSGFDSIQVGVVTTDMGALGASGVPTCGSALGDDGVLRTRANGVGGCDSTYPSFLQYGIDHGGQDEFVASIGCMLGVGIGGCGFEQQLEAALKALSPSAPTRWAAPGYVAPTFHAGSQPHGDGANAGLVRHDSVLAVILLSDEEDCSASDPEVFNPLSAAYRSTDLNLRCFTHADEALHPVGRFVDGLLQLRRHPGRVGFLPIVGIPRDLEPAPGSPIDWERLASDDPSARDDRLVERIDASAGHRLVPSCNTEGRGVAFPPLRILRVARGLEARGARVAVGSICQESYAQSIDAFVDALAR